MIQKVITWNTRPSVKLSDAISKRIVLALELIQETLVTLRQDITRTVQKELRHSSFRHEERLRTFLSSGIDPDSKEDPLEQYLEVEDAILTKVTKSNLDSVPTQDILNNLVGRFFGQATGKEQMCNKHKKMFFRCLGLLRGLLPK
jgi:hypothetical protein